MINPHADDLEYADDRLQSRRDQPKYLNLIRAVAFMRQMQKEVKTRDGREYLEVDQHDIERAHGLARDLLGKNADDLNTVSRDLLAQIDRMVTEMAEKAFGPGSTLSPCSAEDRQ